MGRRRVGERAGGGVSRGVEEGGGRGLKVEKQLKKGWKVVSYSTEKESLVSFLRVVGEVTYKPYHVTKPQEGCGPLCVFDSLESLAGIPVWRTYYPCLYVESKEDTVWSGNEVVRKKYLPAGTILADIVILLPKEEP